MMKKTGAGLLRFCAGLFLSGACLTGGGGGAFAQAVPGRIQLPQTAAAVEPAPVEAAAPEAVAESAPRAPASARWEALQNADPEALKAAEEDCLKAAEALTAKVPDLHRQLREAYEAARQNDPDIQALKRQIADLEAQMEKALENHPAVMEKRQAIEQAQKDMLAELQLRTKLAGLIAAKNGLDPSQISE